MNVDFEDLNQMIASQKWFERHNLKKNRIIQIDPLELFTFQIPETRNGQTVVMNGGMSKFFSLHA